MFAICAGDASGDATGDASGMPITVCSQFRYSIPVFDIRYSIPVFDVRYSIFDIRYSIFDLQVVGIDGHSPDLQGCTPYPNFTYVAHYAGDASGDSSGDASGSVGVGVDGDRDKRTPDGPWRKLWKFMLAYPFVTITV